MAYSTVSKSTDFFQTKRYVGTGSELAVTGVGFQPDLVWVKARGNTYNHQIHDSVRGATAGMLSSNLTDAESGTYEFDSFDSDGFTTDSGNVTGVNGNTTGISLGISQNSFDTEMQTIQQFNPIPAPGAMETVQVRTMRPLSNTTQANQDTRVISRLGTVTVSV